MVSARNYWSTEQLWSDYLFWRGRWRYNSRVRRTIANYQGWVPRNIHLAINKAYENAWASYRVLCRRKPGLVHPDMSSQLAVEGYSRFERPNVERC